MDIPLYIVIHLLISDHISFSSSSTCFLHSAKISLVRRVDRQDKRIACIILFGTSDSPAEWIDLLFRIIQIMAIPILIQ